MEGSAVRILFRASRRTRNGGNDVISAERECHLRETGVRLQTLRAVSGLNTCFAAKTPGRSEQY